ncbi:MAG: BolA family transcriptional regulator [Betaproteobacteria bacterium]|nr:BolA family transcriptional regulator [Betaproteobacteria bacterium]
MSVDEEIRRRLAPLDAQRIDLVDDSARHRGHAGWREGGATHWRLVIVSAKFADLSQVARHRLVYEALGDLMRAPIHAIEIAAHAPGEPGAGTGAGRNPAA